MKSKLMVLIPECFAQHYTFLGGTHITNKDLFGHLPKVSSKIRERRMRVARYCVRHKEEEASKLVGSNNTDKLREEDLRPHTYTLCSKTTVSLLSEYSERQC